MRARRLVAFAPRTLEIEEFDLPDQPEPGQVLAETTCTLVSTGTELANWTGITTQRKPLGVDWRPAPYYPGYSYVGIVRAVGDGVRGVAPGDRISGQARHASAAVMDAERIAVVPPGVTDEQATFATLMTITMNAVRLAKIELGEAVASVGLGLIGNLALQQARLCGALVAAGADPMRERRDYAQRVGLTALDPSATDFSDRVDSLTNGARFDAVFEATGSPGGFNPALRLAGRHGRVVSLGSTRGIVEQVDLYGDVHLRGLTIIGAHASTHPAAANFADRWTEPANRRVAFRLIADGRVDVRSLISHQAPPDEAQALFTMLADRRAEAMGVVLDWRRS